MKKILFVAIAALFLISCGGDKTYSPDPVNAHDDSVRQGLIKTDPVDTTLINHSQIPAGN